MSLRTSSTADSRRLLSLPFFGSTIPRGTGAVLSAPWRRPRSEQPWIVVAALLVIGLVAGSVAEADDARKVEAAESAETIPTTTGADIEPGMELIMSDPVWMGRPPLGAYWSVTGEEIYFYQDREGDHDRNLVRIPSPTTDDYSPLEHDRFELVEGALWGSADPQRVMYSPDRSRAAFERGGDLFEVRIGEDGQRGETRQLTRTVQKERTPFFLADGHRIGFMVEGQPYAHHPDTGLIEQLAEIRKGEDPEDEEPADDYLSRQQTRLLRFVAEKQERREAALERNRERQQLDPTAPPTPVFLGKGRELDRAHLSTDGRSVIVISRPERKKNRKTRREQMPSYVSEDGYVEIREVRPKVGIPKGPDPQLYWLDVESSTLAELDLAGLPGITEDPLADLKAATKAARAAEKAESLADGGDGGDGADQGGAGEPTAPAQDAGEKDAGEKGDPEPRQVEIERVEWSPDGHHAAIQIHSYDNKDRWIVLVSRGEGASETEGAGEPTLRSIHRLQLETWINWSFNEMGWLDSGRLWFLSEESGWSQLYLYDPASDRTRRLTEGDMVVSSPTAAPDGRHIYYTANAEHPGRYDTYRVELDSGKNEKVSTLGGRTDFRLSPSGEHLLLEHSTTTSPTELYLQAAEPGAEARKLTHTVSERFSSIDWAEPEIVEVPSSHQDRPIYSRFYAATDTERYRGDEGKRPAVIFVHGAGYLQNSHMGFSGYFREFMFHTLLSRSGYHVLDMDYRASKGYGVDWRTAIYRQMGTPELEDIEDGVAWLVENHDVDPERVGIYGGSYGGFMTMMALFKRPGMFAAGAALRPVTDWAHYNHPYTSNILNVPEIDPQAYARSSPIEFAAGLEDPLLICAPMLDDNVHFQDTVRLAQRFIELGVEGFEVALFPVEPHGFREPYSWLDEYRRIYALFEEHLAPRE